MMITKKIGIEYSSEGEEVYAYLIGFLTEEIVHELGGEKDYLFLRIVSTVAALLRLRASSIGMSIPV